MPTATRPAPFNDPTVTDRDNFGYSVALDGDNVLIGANRDKMLETDVGQAHLLTIPEPPSVTLAALEPPSATAAADNSDQYTNRAVATQWYSRLCLLLAGFI